MQKIIFNIGLVLFILGVCSADSEWLIFPIALTAIGLILMRATRGVIK